MTLAKLCGLVFPIIPAFAKHALSTFGSCNLTFLICMFSIVFE